MYKCSKLKKREFTRLSGHVSKILIHTYNVMHVSLY